MARTASVKRLLLNGNEAVAYAARQAEVHLGTGYPGTPSTEILEAFSVLGGKAEWSPNEKVALEVGLGVAYAGGRALVTMKHVGLNVAADPLFTAAYTGVKGGLVIVTADDPGMASSQNEQDNRHYARAAGVPMLEPSDSQEAYDYLGLGLDLSELWATPILLRLTTRICHSKTVIRTNRLVDPPKELGFDRAPNRFVMIPAFARPAHRRLRARLDSIRQWSEAGGASEEIEGDGELGIVTSGVSFVHAREAAPDASVLKLGMTYPAPIERIRAFAGKVNRCVVIEEGDPVLATEIRAAGIEVESKPEPFRLGEMSVSRVRAILSGHGSPDGAPKGGKAPQLCPGCPHRTVFAVLKELDCIVTGDIGCYSLGVLPPFEAMDTCVCMGAAIGVGLGMRHVLPDADARRIVSVLGDSTFIHSGLTGVVEMVYNPPPTGHLVIVLDNGTTAMTGLQEHPGTGRRLDHTPANRVLIENVAGAIGVPHVDVVDPVQEKAKFEQLIKDALARSELSLIVARRPCLLSVVRQQRYAQEAKPK